jgi:hypothetical protein
MSSADFGLPQFILPHDGQTADAEPNDIMQYPDQRFVVVFHLFHEITSFPSGFLK